jgi:predicted ArsR family transcriptional regulator
MSLEERLDDSIILEYFKSYRHISFSASRLAKTFGLSAQALSKRLLRLHQQGYLEKRMRGNLRPKSFYKWKK